MPTYYVDKAVGNNANLGTSEGSGNAWETMDYAANQVVPGDIVYVKASADYTENVDFVTSGSSTDPIRWVGYTTTTTDQGKATVDGGSTLSCFTFTTNGAYQIFENFIIKNSVGSGVFFNTPDNHRWINCDFINNASQGVHCDSQQTFIGCTFSGNSANGMFSTSGSGVRVIGCTAFSNSNHQLDWNGTSTANGLCARNLIYGIPNSATWPGVWTYAPVVGCTFDGEGGASAICLDTANTYPMVTDCIFYDANVGVTVSAVGIPTASVHNNHFHNVTTEYSTAISSYDNFDTTGDPLFADEPNDDYSLLAGSPCLDTGTGPS